MASAPIVLVPGFWLGALALFISAVYLVAVFVLGSVVTDQASSTVSLAARSADCTAP